MNNKTILELLESTDSIMNDSHRIKNVLRLDNNLFGFEVINRILIELQYNKAVPAFELKSKQEWEIDGRQVIDGQEPVYIVVPVYKTCYIDIENDVEITDDDRLTHDELVKAVELGLVNRLDNMSSMSVIPVYDIRQTVSIIPEYNVKRINLSTSKLLDIASHIMECNLTLGNEYKYLKDMNNLIVKKDSYINVANALSGIISKYLINNRLKSILLGTKENSDSYILNEDLTFLYKGLNYSINTLFNGDIDINLDIKQDINANKFIYMINCIQCLYSEVVNYVVNDINSDSSASGDYIASISRIKKAEAILAIMEANDIHKIIGG